MLDFYFISIIFGIFISFLFTVLLYFIQHPNKRAKSVFILNFVFLILVYLFLLFKHLKIYGIASILFLIYYPLLFTLYPIFYIYLKLIIRKNFSLSVKKLLQYFSITLIVLVFIWGYYLPLPYEFKVKFLSYNSFEVPADSSGSLAMTIIILLYYLNAAIFIYALIKIAVSINRSKREIILEEEYLPTWLWIFVFGFFSYELVEAVVLILFDLPVKLLAVLEEVIGNTYLIFLGLFGIKQYDLSVQIKMKKLSAHFETENGAIKTKQILTETQKNNIAETIKTFFIEKKLYKDPNLTLDKLAKKIHIPKKNLSLVINELFNKSFTTMLNEYRVDEAKKILLNTKEIKSLEDIYLKVGFNNRSTFNRVFKLRTDLTPHQFKDSHNTTDK